MKWELQVASMVEVRNAYRILVGNAEERPPERWRCRAENNIEMELTEILIG
jgi:hypothetical protein